MYRSKHFWVLQLFILWLSNFIIGMFVQYFYIAKGQKSEKKTTNIKTGLLEKPSKNTKFHIINAKNVGRYQNSPFCPETVEAEFALAWEQSSAHFWIASSRLGSGAGAWPNLCKTTWAAFCSASFLFFWDVLDWYTFLL